VKKRKAFAADISKRISFFGPKNETCKIRPVQIERHAMSRKNLKVKAKQISGKALSRRFDSAIKALEEHWFYDLYSLFKDTSLAARKISAALKEMKSAMRKINVKTGGGGKRTLAVAQAVDQLTDILAELDQHAMPFLHDPYIASCPDIIESELEAILRSRNVLRHLAKMTQDPKSTRAEKFRQKA
jgi:hypothetical protein